jgi:hypothetical protein
MDVVYAVIVCGGLLWLTRSWAPSARFIAWLRAHKPLALAYLRSAPAVTAYTAILVVTSSIYASASPVVGRILLRDQSTNLRQLSHDPLRVLISSAFWTGGATILHVIVPFVFVLAPLERWLGTARFLLVYWCGHICTTLIIATGIWFEIRRGDAPESLSRTIDVGVSYGLYCCCGFFTYRLPGPYRYIWAAFWLGFGTYGIIEDGGFTSYGHLVTILIGFALYPVTRAPAVRRRMVDPIWKIRFSGQAAVSATSA